MAIDSNWIARLQAQARNTIETPIDNNSRAEQKANRLVTSLVGSETASRVDSATETAIIERNLDVSEEAELIRESGEYDAEFVAHVDDSPRLVALKFPQTAEDSGLINTSIQWDESQQAAMKRLAKTQYGALIGAAGTGKTTLVKALLAKMIYGDEELGVDAIGLRELGEPQGPSIAICAYTGIATQVVKNNLPEWLAPACKTIHTLLEYKPIKEDRPDPSTGTVRTVQYFEPTRGLDRKLDHDVIVIDEASMLGLDLWHNLLDACKPHTRIILIGDINQLKPVADHTMFAYALAAAIDESSSWTVAELTTIHRQKEAAANRIIDTAHQILQGEKPTFDDPSKEGWRVIGLKLPNNAVEAGKTVVGIAMQLTQKRGPDGQVIYDPYRDRIMTAGNGEDENNTASSVQQIAINELLSRFVEAPSETRPIFIIDAGRVTRKFAVGHRVMATKNEPPAVENRVTNGMTGRILEIVYNTAYEGDIGFVGPEEDVKAHRQRLAKQAVASLRGERVNTAPEGYNLEAMSSHIVEAVNSQKEEREQERAASHVVTVKFDNGATRVFRSCSGVGGLQLAYATTVHKAQGSQCDTAIIVCHHAVKSQLSREWLYTGWTRAVRRVVFLYTDAGMLNAIHKQQIFGKSTAEKIRRYAVAMNTKQGTGALVRLEID